MSSVVPSSSTSSEKRFQQYVDRLAGVLGHADRHEPLRLYATGLLLPGERKSVEPMAARVDPQRVRSRHQSLHHFVADADWSDAAVLAAVRDFVLPAFVSSGGVRAWIVDESFREGVTALGLRYAVAIQAHTSVWREGQTPLSPTVYKGIGRPAKLLHRDEQRRPVSVQ